MEGATGNRRRIRLIKASSSEASTASSENDENDPEGNAKEDFSTMKLGSWFTSKHPVQTLDRKKAKMVYPSAVYLDNLENANSGSPVKMANKSEVVTDEENFEDDLNHQRTTSRAKITKKVALHDANSVSSLDTIKSEDVVTQPRPRNSSESTVTSETAALTGSRENAKIRSYKKNHGSYKLANKGTASKKNLLEAVAASNSHNTSHTKKMPSVHSKSNLSGSVRHDNQSQISSSREGSFRFLEHEEIEHTPTPKRAQSSALGKKDEDAVSIQWSTNNDRLI